MKLAKSNSWTVSSKHEFHGHIINLNKINDNSIIIDGGANVGGFIEKMREYTNAQIYAIECSPGHCARIEDARHSNVEVLQKALVGVSRGPCTFTEFEGPLKEDGHKRYYQWGNIFGEHVPRLGPDPLVQVSQYEVEPITIKELLQQYKWKQIDYLKLDVEGAEYEIIERLEKPESTLIKQISLESHGSIDCGDGLSAERKNADLIARLESLGYKTELFANNEVYAWRED
jgi:FkbM family methyltransferase